MDGDLKPCPACGREPMVDQIKRAAHYVVCPVCDHRPVIKRPLRGMAVNAWNQFVEEFEMKSLTNLLPINANTQLQNQF